MSVMPIQLSRVSFNQRTMSLIDQMRRDSVQLLESQSRLASGRRLLRPSDDPIDASVALRLDAQLAVKNQISRTLQFADNFVSATDAAMTEISDMLNQARALALETVGSTSDQTQRDAAAQTISSIINEMLIIGNRKLLDLPMFAGRETGSVPFREISGGILYTGDTGDLRARASDIQELPFNLTGDALYGALSSEVIGFVDLDPALTSATRLADLNGARGLGVSTGIIRIVDSSGPNTWDVDLSAAHNMQDVIDLVADATGGAVTAAISGGALTLSGPADLTVLDVAGGTTAADLGILQTTPVASPINGTDVDPRLTLTTTLASLSGGAGLTLIDPLRITNGPHTATVDLSGAQTIEDVLNALNNAGVYVRATINAAGTGIDVVNRLSGSDLRISEAGGTTATSLGIRSYTGETLLSSLNNGRGVDIVAGKIDLLIRDSNEVEYGVNLDGARTVQDVIDLINAATGGAVTASLAADGNGIRLVEAAPGAGQLRVLTPDPTVSASFAAEDLGFAGAETVVGSGEIVSRDVNGIQPRGVFSVLLRLRDALLAGDTAKISIAAEELQAVNGEIIRTHGMVGATSQMFNRRLDQIESDAAQTQAQLTTLVEVDYAEAITQFTQLQTAAQAGMLSAAQLLNISFLDFLR